MARRGGGCHPRHGNPVGSLAALQSICVDGPDLVPQIIDEFEHGESLFGCPASGDRRGCRDTTERDHGDAT